jgi:ADP-ribose diphosphatase
MTDNTDKPWHATVVKTLHQNPWYSVLLQKVTVPDGTERDYYTIHFPRPAVGVVARRGTDILLIRQYRFIVDEYVWAIPSGGVEPGETPEKSARRELEEEAGYQARSIRPLLTCYASYGCSNQLFQIFLADDVEPVERPPDANEVMHMRWFTRAQVLEMIRANGIVDNLSLSPLLLVLLGDAE